MDNVDVAEAAKNLPSLLHRVERGETIVISRHGKPVARLVIEDPISALLEFRKCHLMKTEELTALIEDGRKY